MNCSQLSEWLQATEQIEHNFIETEIEGDRIELRNGTSWRRNTALHSTQLIDSNWLQLVAVARIEREKNDLPEEKRKPTQQKYAHYNAQRPSSFVFSTPSLCRSYWSIWDVNAVDCLMSGVKWAECEGKTFGATREREKTQKRNKKKENSWNRSK